MAHQTMVGGTKYAITGGRTLVGGTAYGVVGGKTRVDGTAYDIAFAPGPIAVKITGSGNALSCYVTIAGTKYYSAKTLEIEPGTAIEVMTNGYSSSMVTITLNGTKVGTTKYSFVPDCNTVTIKLSAPTTYTWKITITTD